MEANKKAAKARKARRAANLAKEKSAMDAKPANPLKKIAAAKRRAAMDAEANLEWESTTGSHSLFKAADWLMREEMRAFQKFDMNPARLQPWLRDGHSCAQFISIICRLRESPGAMQASFLHAVTFFVYNKHSIKKFLIRISFE